MNKSSQETRGKNGEHPSSGEDILQIKGASIRSVAQALNIELGSLIDSGEIWDLRDGYIRHALGTERITLKIYYKDRLSQGRFEEIKQFHQQRVCTHLPLWFFNMS